MPAVEPTSAGENDLRVVVDAQIVLAMFLVRRDRPDAISPKRQLLNLLPLPTFHWLWTSDIISDYERGAEAIEADERIMQRAEFDRLGFQLFLAACNFSHQSPFLSLLCETLVAEYLKLRVRLSVILTTLFIWRVQLMA